MNNIFFFSSDRKTIASKIRKISLSVYLRLLGLSSAILTGIVHPLLNIYAHASAKLELRGKLNLWDWFHLKVGDLWPILCCVNLRLQRFIYIKKRERKESLFIVSLLSLGRVRIMKPCPLCSRLCSKAWNWEVEHK